MSVQSEVWARHVEDQVRGGKTQRAYCAEHGLQPRNFRRWAQRLARMNRIVAPADLSSHSAGPSATPRTYEVHLPDPVPEVLPRSEPRRRWTEDQKLRLVEETFASGNSISRVSRRYGVHTSVLFRWRRQLVGPRSAPSSAPTPKASFAAVQIAAEQPALPSPDPAVPSSVTLGVIEIELASGHRVRVDRHVDADALRRVLAALAPH